MAQATKRKLGTEQLNQDIARFKEKPWQSDENKSLLNLVSEKRLNLAPSTLYNYDKLGLNHLEIISLAGMTGKKITELPTADKALVDEIESRFNIKFAYEERMIGKDSEAKMDGYCGGMNANGEYPLVATAVFGLDLYI